MIRFPALALAAALLLSACDSSGSTDVETQPVLSAFLEAEQAIEGVSLSVTRTVPIGEFYDADAAAVLDATGEMQLLAPDGSVEMTYPLAREISGTGYRLLVPPVTLEKGGGFSPAARTGSSCRRWAAS